MLKQALYQVNVEQRDGSVIPVGPKMLKEYAEMFMVAIKGEIMNGREHDWSNPHLKICL